MPFQFRTDRRFMLLKNTLTIQPFHRPDIINHRLHLGHEEAVGKALNPHLAELLP